LRKGNLLPSSTDIDLRANGRVSTLSQYIYSPTGERIGVEQVHLEAPGDISIAGNGGVEMQAAQVIAWESLTIRSERGDVIDRQIVTDMVSSHVNDDTAIQKSTATTTSLVAGEGMTIEAGGKIQQQGTQMRAGKKGIRFDAQEHSIKPAVEETVVLQVANGGRTDKVKGANE
jgi:hypothetical protein